MPEFVVTCPGCRRPLHVPPAAVGKPASCPHCKAGFALPANPDGSPGEPRPAPARPALPRMLAVPAVGLVMLGLAGLVVNGYLVALFAGRDGADLDYARGLVQQNRSIEALAAAMKGSDYWALAPDAALGGPAGAVAADDARAENQAAAARPQVGPRAWQAVAVSSVALLGGLAILRGRFYPLAVLGCVAAAVNVNHLCCVPGAIAGVWGLLALIRDDGRAYFRPAAR